MSTHSAVEKCKLLKNEDEYIYEVKRSRFQDTVRVWLSDLYSFGNADFIDRPKEIKKGDYILIARPEAMVYPTSDEHSGIGIGKLSDFMGALNKKEMWKYVPLTDEEKIEKQKKRSNL